MKWIDLDHFPPEEVIGCYQDGSIEFSNEDLYNDITKVLNRKKWNKTTFPEIIQTLNVLKFSLIQGMFNARAQDDFNKIRKDHR